MAKKKSEPKAQKEREKAKATSGRKELVGEVLSNKMEKTAVVAVETKRAHPIYKKLVKSRKKYFAHVPEGVEVEEGDRVVIVESRPMSKNKKWSIVKEQ